MRRALPLVLCVGLLSACSDKGSADRAEAQKQFDKALTAFQNADLALPGRSATTSEAPGVPGADVVASHNKALDQAIGDLRAVMNKGPQSNDIAARQLISDAYASTAGDTARAGMAAWADIDESSGELVSLLLAVDSAGARAASVSIDEAPLLGKLHDEQSATEESIKEMQGRAEKLKAKVDESSKSVDSLNAQADAEQAQVLKLRSQAFAKQGKAQDDMYHQSVVQSESASRASSAAQKLAVELDMASSELAVLSKQIELRQASIKALQDQVDRIGQQQTENQKQHDDALKDKEAQLDKLKSKAGDFIRDYAAQVEKPMSEATTQAQEAIATLGEAAGKAKGSDKRPIQVSLLGEHAQLGSIMARYVYAQAGYNHILDFLVSQSQRVAPGASLFTKEQAEGKTALDSLVGNAKDAIGKGLALAAELRGGAADEHVDKYYQNLQDYTRGIDEAIGAAAPTTAPSDSSTN